MRRGQIAAVDLGVALSAIAVESALQAGARTDIDQTRAGMRAKVWPRAVSGMAPQAQECRRLVQQVVGDCPVWVMTNPAVLRHGRVLVHERTLFFRMAATAHHVDGRFLQVTFSLTVRIVTIRTHHLALFNGMVRRHGVLGIHVCVALVTNVGIIDGHRQTLWTEDLRMGDVDKLPDRRVRMRIVTIGACHSVQIMSRRMPRRRRRTRVALQAQIFS